MSTGGAQFKYLYLGSSYPGFTINFYEAGTSTPKNVWLDEGKTTAVQQVTADSNGMATWYADGDYKMEVKDSDGVLLYTWDNVKISSDTATMWEGNSGTSYPVSSSLNRWQLFAKHDANNNFEELGINDGDTFVRLIPGIPADTYSSLNDAISQIGSTETDLIITKQISMTGDATVPSTMRLVFARGGSIDQSTYTLTINGHISAGLYQIFDGSGTVTIGGYVPVVYPEWWGARGDGSTDDTDAINAAATAAEAKILEFQAREYDITAKITLPTRIWVRGKGFETVIDATSFTGTTEDIFYADFTEESNQKFLKVSDL
jgi:hypothetical protein